MTSNVKMILDEVNARIKLAEAKTAEDPSNFDSFPGAENDKAAPSEAKKPDPEVKDEGPASRTEATGAEPGSDVPLQQDHLYEADEPILTPEKKPAETADANAKTASANPDVEKVAADILGIIRGSIQKKAKCGGKCEGKCNKEEKDSSCGKCGTCGKKAVSKCASEQENDVSRNISLETKILDKLASVRMAKQAGARDAENLVKAAAYDQGVSDAITLIQKMAQDASATDVPPEMTAPEAEGAADAEAAIADAAAMDAAGAEPTSGEDIALDESTEDPVTPEEVVEAVDELVQEGQISEEDAAAIVSQIGEPSAPEEGITEDQIAEGIAEAVDSGELAPEEAQQLVQELIDAGASEDLQEEIPEMPADTADAGEKTAQYFPNPGIFGPQTTEAATSLLQYAKGHPLKALAAALALGAVPTAAAVGAHMQGEKTLAEKAKLERNRTLGGGAIGGATGASIGTLYRMLNGDKKDTLAYKAAPYAGGVLGAGLGALAGSKYHNIAGTLSKIKDNVSKTVGKLKKKASFQKQAEDEQIARYQYGFIQKCAEYGCDPQRVAQYIQARQSGAL